MGVLYARVSGQWVPVIAPPPAVTVPDEVWVGPNTPPAAETELWVDSDLTPAPMLFAKIGGTWTQVSAPPTDEVTIQPDTPTGQQELWYDTDDEPLAADNANYWNSAWGQVAAVSVSTDIALAVGTTTVATAANVTLVAGRRYEATFFGVGDCSAATLYLSEILQGATVVGQQRFNMVAAAQLSYVCSGSQITGTGATTFTARVQLFTGTMNMRGTFFPAQLVINDVGPVTKAAVNPPAGQPQDATAGNALGLVAQGPVLGSVTVTTSFTTVMPAPVAVTLLVGRRYRVAFSSRAMGGGAQTVTYQVALYDNGASNGWFDHWATSTANYSNIYCQAIVNGDGLAHSLDVRMLSNPTGAGVFGGSASGLWIEDIGPTQAPALPIPDTPPAWTPVTFANGWTNFPGSEQPAQYRKIGDVVYLRGVITGGTMQQSAFILPVGFRPPNRTYKSGGAVSGGAWQAALTLIDSDGGFKPWLGVNTQRDIDFSFSVTP